MNKSISLAFFGSSKNSLTVLEALLEAGYQIELVVTAPPRPVGRKKTITKTAPHIFAEENQISVLSPEKLDHTFLKEFNKYNLDVSVVADYARLIPKKVLSYPKHGFLNLHPSLLPKYRGSSPAEAAILAGDKITGMTVIQMDEKFDHGPIISQFEEEILESDTSEILYRRLFTAGAKVLATILPAWVESRIVPRNQDHKKATLAPRLSRDDGFIPWDIIQKAMYGEPFHAKSLNPYLRKAYNVSNLESEEDRIFAANYGQGESLASRSMNQIQSEPNLREQKNTDPQNSTTKKILAGQAKFIERAIRAFHPWPGIWTLIETKNQEAKIRKKRMKILSAHIEQGKLTLDQVQLEGKNPANFSEIKNQILQK